MRWQPDSPVCAECGFAWTISRDDAIDVVTQLPETATAAVARIRRPMQQISMRWSASMYVWHLVDVLRIGTERLLTLTHDPGRGITCWDENALAQTRRYAQLSPAVGFGDLGALQIIRRNAHKAHHHLMDINRYRDL